MGGTASRAARFTMESSQGQLIKDSIDTNCVVIFSKTYCGYCRMAKRVFDDIGTPYAAVELDKRADGDQVQELLQDMTGNTTVPIVFVNGKFVGGGTETKALHQEGKLINLIDECKLSAKSGL